MFDLLLLWILIVLTVAGIGWILSYGFLSAIENSSFFAICIGLAAIGATVGTIGGISRVGAVGEIVAAALGLLGGIVVYLFATNRELAPAVSVCTAVFSLSLFASYIESAQRRALPDSYIFWRSECVSKFMNKEVMDSENASSALSTFMGEICGQIFLSEKERLLGSSK